jgi:transposase InsO family protein
MIFYQCRTTPARHEGEQVRRQERGDVHVLFELIAANQASFPVRAMCRVLRVSPSGFYARQDRPPSQHAMEDAVLMERIRQIHAASDENYGSPNIHAELRDEGARVGRKRVARLMRAAGLRGVSRRRSFIVTTCRDPAQRPAPDLVNRQFVASSPNQLWVADMTYVPTWAGFIFLAIVLDVWSRRVVGWAIGEHMIRAIPFECSSIRIWCWHEAASFRSEAATATSAPVACRTSRESGILAAHSHPQSQRRSLRGHALQLRLKHVLERSHSGHDSGSFTSLLEGGRIQVPTSQNPAPTDEHQERQLEVHMHFLKPSHIHRCPWQTACRSWRVDAIKRRPGATKS